MKEYSVVEVFLTLQGEGSLVGTPAVFVRFAGCNMWSGEQEHRHRDKIRNFNECAMFCDTDFRNGKKYTARALIDAIIEEVESHGLSDIPLLVMTGGEPLLQVDVPLMNELRGGLGESMVLAIETNGSIDPGNQLISRLDHICVSPKQKPDQIKLRRGTEIKVVWPTYNPAHYNDIAPYFEHRFVSPEAVAKDVGFSVLKADHMERAARWCMRNAPWRLSLQTHKITNVP